jgi:hypothetical protein
VQNGSETDIDCGGGSCSSCLPGRTCAEDGDCRSDVCTQSVCQRPTCSDGVQNGDESDVDCGGTQCDACSGGDSCKKDRDCRSGVCQKGSCLNVFRSCQQAKKKNPNAKDGVYTIDPDGPNNSQYRKRKVYCEMTFRGGGWTAVFNMMKMPPNSNSAQKMQSIITQNKPMTQPVRPDSTSGAIYTSNLPLDQYNEVVYGWAPTSGKDVTRWGQYRRNQGLAGECHLDGYCSQGSTIATMQIYPQNITQSIRTAPNPSYPHVGIGYSSMQVTWGYDRNQTQYGPWANWSITSCCNSGNVQSIAQSNWRYVIYIR